MPEILDRLLSYKEKVQAAKSKFDQIKGSIENDMEQLKKQDCKTLEEAKGKIANLSNQLNEKDTQFQTGVENLGKNYKWDENV